MDVKPGDVVTVRGTVQREADADGDVYIRFANRMGEWAGYVRPDQIVSVEPRPLQVGDKVRVGSGSLDGIVLALHVDKVWVDVRGEGPYTYNLTDLLHRRA